MDGFIPLLAVGDCDLAYVLERRIRRPDDVGAW
jgi:hypothetical protein